MLFVECANSRNSNDMVQQLDTFARELKRVARDVGVDGKMGGQAAVDNVRGRWKEITEDVVSRPLSIAYDP